MATGRAARLCGVDEAARMADEGEDVGGGAGERRPDDDGEPIARGPLLGAGAQLHAARVGVVDRTRVAAAVAVDERSQSPADVIAAKVSGRWRSHAGGARRVRRTPRAALAAAARSAHARRRRWRNAHRTSGSVV